MKSTFSFLLYFKENAENQSTAFTIYNCQNIYTKSQEEHYSADKKINL